MSEDKRSVATDALAVLGTIIDETIKRDAIHLAVDPVIAGEKLAPGDHIGVKGGVAFKCHPLLGIVDPFLEDDIEIGQRFLLVIYPRKITSLRHVWTHPDFDNVESNLPASIILDDKEKSIKWIKDYVSWINEKCIEYRQDNIYHLTYEELMREASDVIEDNYGSIVFPFDEGHELFKEEFWDHYEIITGEKFPEDQYKNFFRCGC